LITAGIRRKGKNEADGGEGLRGVMAPRILKTATSCCSMVDATGSASGLDANIEGYAHEEGGRSVIISGQTKWDLVARRRESGRHQASRTTARIQDAKRPQGRALLRRNACAMGSSFSPMLGGLSIGAHWQGNGRRKTSSADREGGSSAQGITTGEE